MEADLRGTMCGARCCWSLVLPLSNGLVANGPSPKTCIWATLCFRGDGEGAHVCTALRDTDGSFGNKSEKRWGLVFGLHPNSTPFGNELADQWAQFSSNHLDPQPPADLKAPRGIGLHAELVSGPTKTWERHERMPPGTWTSAGTPHPSPSTAQKTQTHGNPPANVCPLERSACSAAIGPCGQT